MTDVEKRLARLARRANRSREELESALVEAVAAGVSYRRLAEITNIPHTTIRGIVERRR